MGVLCFHQVFDLLLLCTKCIPCAVALLLHTGVENECCMAEGVAVLLTQHQRVVVERQDQRASIPLGTSTWKLAGEPESDWTLTPHSSGSRRNASSARCWQRSSTWSMNSLPPAREPG